MKVFLTSAYPEEPSAVAWLKDSAAMDPFRNHAICDSPKDADIVLFAETHPANDIYLFRARFHPLFRKFRRKAFIYQDWYLALPLSAGLFTGYEKHRLPFPCASIHYLARRCENDAVAFDDSTDRPYLFSFVGSSRTAEMRKELLALKHPRAVLRDTGEARAWNMTKAEKQVYEGEYAKVMAQSLFVLCPRGLGPGSYRLYEAMEMGRAPVIISDRWEFPKGPNWEEFSIVVEEREMARIPEILERAEGGAIEMGWAARKAWEDWCSQKVSFHRVAEACSQIQRNRTFGKNALCSLAHLALLWPPHLRNLIRCVRRKFRKQ